MISFKDKMSWSNWMNLFFVVVLIPFLLLWAYNLNRAQVEISKFNAEQIEDCYMLDCESDWTGSIKCEKHELKGEPVLMNQSFTKNMKDMDKNPVTNIEP